MRKQVGHAVGRRLMVRRGAYLSEWRAPSILQFTMDDGAILLVCRPESVGATYDEFDRLGQIHPLRREHLHYAIEQAALALIAAEPMGRS